jgi:CheY-like chemotaxis protein
MPALSRWTTQTRDAVPFRIQIKPVGSKDDSSFGPLIMTTTPPPRVVAVLDSDPDTTEMLKTMMEFAGMVAATGNLIDFRLGKDDLIAFLQRTKPDVIVYDLSPPYESNYHYLQKVREDPRFPRCGLVITTTNARAVESLLGIQAVEIFSKPYPLDGLVRAVQSATVDVPTASVHTPGTERRNGDRRGGDRRTSDGRGASGPPVH